MTVKDYNEKFYPQYNKAVSFVSCMEHALQKSDDNARMQMKVIGWDEETKAFLLDALRQIKDAAKVSYSWTQSEWWGKESEDTE